MAYDDAVSPYPNEPDPWPHDPADAARPAPYEPAAHAPEYPATPEAAEYPTEFTAHYTVASGAPPQHARPPLDPLTLTRLIAAWAIILVCTLALFFIQDYGMAQLAEEAKSDSRPGFQALYISRLGMGMHGISKTQSAQFMAEYDALTHASTHPELAALRGAVLAGDLKNREVAQDRLAYLFADGLTYADDATQPTAEQRQVDQLIQRVYNDKAFVPSASERAQLIERHGYFGELAAGYNLPRTDPLYQGPRQSVKWMAIGLFSLLGVVGLAFLTGLVLLVVLIILLASGAQKLAMPRGRAGHPVVYLEVVALFLVWFIVLQLIVGLLGEVTGLDLTAVFLLLSPIVLLWPRLTGVRWKQFCQDMGYHRGKGVFFEIASGIGGYLAGLPIIAIGFACTFVLGYFSSDTADHPMQQEITDGNLFSIMMLIAAAVVWAPLVEESIFRSAFYRHLRQLGGVPGWMIATVVTSFIFAAIHPQGWIGIPVLMSIAFVLAALREWRGSIIPSITAHALHNGTIMVFLMLILYA